ncbi:hypothetical protein M427DRAFT_133526 [Gonapodya prolifera JEL478]|uniref:SH3 domain-containing protein n=1 Tax=Gonapodya prolifera (strain JEL478) TaxID=1344416 RepID=A0A139AL37_GONPJ|nr:hypothetical protein M427DRAFT_133526 [Gonapodya prolifera JEL478]|eukprot:KXS17408.1 hypothetical protein M427DRAFT_133526 [Gonapodya prolifera JEL478]
MIANDFSGPFPDISGMTNLTQLHARANRFTTMPVGIETLVGLRNLHFYLNNVTGPFPNLTALKDLFTLWVHDNFMSGNVDGLIPRSVSVCRLTFNNTNPDLYTLTRDVPPSCFFENQVIRNPNDLVPSPAAAPAPNSSGSGSNVGIIAGAVGGGAAVLLAAIGLAFYVVRRKRGGSRHTKSPEHVESHWFFLRVAGPMDLDEDACVEYDGQPFLVTEKYDAQAADEMTLTPGQTVIVKTIFRDGWAACLDESTGQVGTAPLDCLLLTDHLHSSASHNPLSFPIARGEVSMIRSVSLSAAYPFPGSQTTAKDPTRSAAVHSMATNASPGSTLFNTASPHGSAVYSKWSAGSTVRSPSNQSSQMSRSTLSTDSRLHLNFGMIEDGMPLRDVNGSR